MLSFSINRPSMQLLQREGPNSSLTTLRTKTEYIYMYIYKYIYFFAGKTHTEKKKITQNK